MTPQEIERTLEFILEHEAQAAAHIQRLAERQGEVQSMFVLMTELVHVQSQRLDRHDETLKSVQETLQSARETQQSMQSLQREALARLDQILDRLTRNH